MKNLVFAIMTIFLIASFTVGTAHASTDYGIAVIVNADNPVSEIDVNDLIDFFLKKSRRWHDGTTVRFFDQKVNSEERNIFLKKYLRKTDREVDLYWIGQKLYHGDSAPLQVEDSTMAAEMVSSFKGGIGYVIGPVTEGKGVKKIQVTGLK